MLVEENVFSDFINKLYGGKKSVVDYHEQRHQDLIRNYQKKFGAEDDVKLFSVPGRTELGGNHTDHGNGKVLAAAVNLDTIAAASPNGGNDIVLYSDGYEEVYSVNLDLLEKREDETGTSSALIRGVASFLEDAGFTVGGFNAFVESNVLNGAGLSSSAAFEILIGVIFSALFNEQKIPTMALAKAGQFAENNYFGKPCGLMDQLACATGGIIAIDFEDFENPKIEKINFFFKEYGYKLLIVDTGGNHANLTDEYSSIPEEMKNVAEILGKQTIRKVERKELYEHIAEIRKEAGDRALLRALHYINENERVEKQKEALKKSDFTEFLSLVKKSGDSSYKLLQNVVSVKKTSEQGIALALATTEDFFKSNEIDGVCRVHGGGFAGSIQVYLPVEKVAEYKEFIEAIFGNGGVIEVEIRVRGAESS